MADQAGPLFEFLPLTLRAETKGGVATPLVLRGTPLPATRSKSFTTTVDGQSAVEIELLIGESVLAQGNARLGSFTLAGIPDNRRGQASIKIEFAVDSSCSVAVTATVEGTDISGSETFQPPETLTNDFIERALADVASSREADEAALRTIEATNRAKDALASAEEKLASRPDYRIDEAVAALGLALASGDSRAIRDRTDNLLLLLSRMADPFGEASVNDLLDTFLTTTAAPTEQGPTQQKREQTREKEMSSPALAPGLGRVFGGGSFTLDTQLCFVLMPFAAKFRPVYDEIIRPAVEAAGLRCERADEIRGASVITWDIWERINRSRLLVAELTDRNSNVFYELGLAHALSKDVILLTQAIDFVPFDLKALRCLVYDTTADGMQRLDEALAATIAAVLKSA